MEEKNTVLQLSEQEQRVIGVLIEKSRTTPDYYPMTIAAIVTACNQKTSRNPIVEYSEETVSLTLNALKIKGLSSTVTGGSSRSTKYKHNLAIAYPLVPAELAVICLLLLRGALTPGEINTNSARLYEFDTIEEIQVILQKLSEEEPAYVQQLAKKPGQKEARYIHLFGTNTSSTAEPEQADTAAHFQQATHSADLEARIANLELELKDVKEMLNLLLNQST